MLPAIHNQTSLRSTLVTSWIRLAALGIGLLWAYLLVVLFLGANVFGINVRTRHVALLAACGMAGVYWLLRWTLRRELLSVSRLKGIAVGSIVGLLSILVIDVGYTIYFQAIDPARLPAHFLQPYYRVTDPQIWLEELIPRRYHPTARNFRLHKPGVVSGASIYGDLYYPEMKKSPTLVESVLKRRNILHSIDKHGFRETTPLEEARVFALGDSFAFGVGVTQDRTWVKVLEHVTGKAVYNLGVSGNSPKQQVMLLEYLFETKPELLNVNHLLWMIFEGNDLEEPYDTYHEITISEDDSSIFKTISEALSSIASGIKNQAVVNRLMTGQIALRSPLAGVNGTDHYNVDGVRLMSALYHSSRYGYRLFYPQYIDRATKSRSYVLDHPNRPLLEQTFADMAALSRKHGFRVIIVIAPSAPRLYGPYFDDFPSISKEPHFIDYVARLARDTGFESIDLYRLMQPYAEKELLYWPDDTHWNKRGHEVVAELIAKHAKF